jgi:precorrin-3B synthase
MEAADGMLLRVRVPGGAITSDGLRAVAEVAERFGSGVIELTVRANLQIRGVAPVDVAAAGDRLVLAGLALADPVRDERRDVIGSPLAGHDPTELVDLSGVLPDVAERLATEPGLDGLPPKFGVVLDGGGTVSVRPIPADVALGAVRTDEGHTVLQLELGRALDRPPSAWIEVADIVPLVLAAAHLSAAHGQRMATLVDLIGRKSLMNALTAGTPIAQAIRGSKLDGALPILPPMARPAPIGVSAHRDDDLVNIGAAPFLGRTSPAALRSVADLADAAGGSIRFTPWRGAVLAGVRRSQGSTTTAALAAAGFSSDPEDPAHLVSACVGLPGCASSTADTQAAARALLHGGGLTSRIHFSGCEKRCGADADHVVVAGEDGELRIGAR